MIKFIKSFIEEILKPNYKWAKNHKRGLINIGLMVIVINWVGYIPDAIELSFNYLRNSFKRNRA